MKNRIASLLVALSIVVTVTAFAAPEDGATDPTAFVQAGKVVASAVGGTEKVDMAADGNPHTAVFTSIATNKRFDPTADILWAGRTIRSCIDDEGNSLAAKTTSVARWVCKIAPPPPVSPARVARSKMGR